MSLEKLWSGAIVAAARKLWGIEIDPALEPSEHADCASSFAFKLAKQLKKAPKAIAGELAGALKAEHLDRVEVAGPGYLNLFAAREYFTQLTRQILTEASQFGRSVVGDGIRVNVEFCSANPTGPLHIGHARQAVTGDVLCNCFEFCGYDVTREFYINDTGNQVRMLGTSLLARMTGAPIPENGYHGQYIQELAEKIRDAQGDRFVSMPAETAVAELGRLGAAILLEAIRKDLEDFRVRFDVWTSQEKLEADGVAADLLKEWRTQGRAQERDGAVWWNDLVLIKSDGTLAYRTTDFAYHRDKLRRGFEWIIDLWGPDHHAHVAAMTEAMRLFGTEDFRVLIVQHCRLMSAGQEVRMSKRAGTFEALRDLIDEVGVDSTRYFFAMRNPNSHMDFDLDVAKKQDKDNPAYYAQYAVVRVNGILRKAPEDNAAADLSLMGAPEIGLVRRLRTFERTVQKVVELLDPGLLHQFLGEIATAYQRYYELGNNDPAMRVLCDDAPTRRMRLAVSRAFQQVAANALRLLGVSTPERM